MDASRVAPSRVVPSRAELFIEQHSRAERPVHTRCDLANVCWYFEALFAGPSSASAQSNDGTSTAPMRRKQHSRSMSARFTAARDPLVCVRTHPRCSRRRPTFRWGCGVSAGEILLGAPWFSLARRAHKWERSSTHCPIFPKNLFSRGAPKMKITVSNKTSTHLVQRRVNDNCQDARGETRRGFGLSGVGPGTAGLRAPARHTI